MTIRIIALLKRKPGMSPEAFRHEYETGHARLAVKLFGHIWKEYRRNYVQSGGRFVDITGQSADDQEPPLSATSYRLPATYYDVVTEMVVENNDALEEMNRIASENGRVLREDEHRLFDRVASWVLVTETVEEDLRANHKSASDKKGK